MPIPCAIAFCPLEARAGLRPHLCGDHAYLVVCPTCDDWTIRDRNRCKTCRGRWFVPPESAAYALRHGVRLRRLERTPAINDRRWPSWEHADAEEAAQEPRRAISSREGDYPVAGLYVLDPEEGCE